MKPSHALENQGLVCNYERFQFGWGFCLNIVRVWCRCMTNIKSQAIVIKPSRLGRALVRSVDWVCL